MIQISPHSMMTRESIQQERERLFEKARHDEAQALYHAKQEGISERNIEIARSMMADGKPVSKIIRYTGLSLKELEHIDE